MSLNKLLAMQKAAREAQAESKGESAAKPPLAVAKKDSPAEPESGAGSGTALPTESSTPAPNPKRLPFGNKPKPSPSTALVPAKPAAPPAKKESLSLDNLGSFDVSSIDELDDTDVPEEFAGFHDEIEATAPDRELPEDLSAEGHAFVESLNRIYEILNDSEMFGQQIRQLMMELQENPEFQELLSDQDVHVMIRAMRNTMGLARVKKQSKQRKSGTTAKSRAPSKKQALMDKALGLSIGIPGLGDVD